MTVLPLLAVGILMKFVAMLFVLVALVLVLTILIQKGRGGGLSGAFGGGMASGLLGSKTGDFLTWVTIVMAGVFLTLAVLMAKFYRPPAPQYGVPAETGQSVPAASSAPPTPVPADTSGRPAPAGDANTGG